MTFVATDSRDDGGYLLAVGEDITERRELESVLYHQSRHDPLTGLANRLLLQETLQHSITAAGPADRLGLCYIDLDGFKSINDHYGHGIGDRLLAALADRLRTAVAPGQLIARVGGDEFVAVLPSPVDTTAVVAAAQRLLTVVDAPSRSTAVRCRSRRVSVSWSPRLTAPTPTR